MDRKGEGRKHPIRHRLNAVFYLTKTGCQWAMLPKTYPPRKAVESFFYRAKKRKTWDAMIERLVVLDREASLSMRRGCLRRFSLKKGIGMTETPLVLLWLKYLPIATLWQIKGIIARGFVGNSEQKHERLALQKGLPLLLILYPKWAITRVCHYSQF